MEENNNNQEQQELTEEEKLEQASSRADNLLSELEKTKNKFTDVLAELNKKQSDIENLVNEINTTKETFINNVNEQLSNYDEKFRKNNEDINAQKNSVEQSSSELVSNFKTLTEKYEQEANTAIEEIQGKINEITNMLKGEKEDFDKFLSESRTNYDKQFKEIDNLISQYKASTTESLTSIKARLDESTNNSEKIKQIEAQAKVFKESLDEYVQTMQEKTNEINEKTKKFSEDTQTIIDTNSQLTDEIKEQLEKATGVSLFHMFQKRKEALEGNQKWWLIGIIVSVLILISFSCWIICSLPTAQNSTIDWFKDAIFKFTLSSPAIYLLYFFSDRYTKLRRLIEEYAFKSAISLALTPYFDLVKGLDDETEEKDKDFLIAVIGNIFKTPTDKVFRTKESNYDLDFSSYYKNIANVFNPSTSEENK